MSPAPRHRPLLGAAVAVLALSVATAWPAAADDASPLVPVADHLWHYVHEDHGAKSVVAEFATFLVVIESPGDEAAARALLADLGEAFPGKSVRVLLHTHHHGHSLAAIDPWLARDVMLVTAPANVERLRERTANPERFAASFLPASDGLVLADGTNELRVHVIDDAQYEVPTPEYVIIEFPRQQVMVSGCLYNKPASYHEVVNKRKPALRRYLREHAPDVVTLVPTNTCASEGFEDVCTVAMLDATLAEGIDPQEVADRLEAMTVAEIAASLDELVAEFSARTLRAYDLLVCANTIRREREDLPRAALFFEVAARAFPDEASPAYYHGMALLENGEDARAEVAWERALALADDDDERERLQQRMEAARERVAADD
jgi:hypothetical protein